MYIHFLFIHFNLECVDRSTDFDQSRPLVVCEGARVLPTRATDQDASDRSGSCTLEVCGFVRQTHLSAGQIAYLSGIGDHEIAYITRHLRIEAEARGTGERKQLVNRAIDGEHQR